MYALTPTELHRLDAYEGYPTVYRSEMVRVDAELMGVATRFRIPAMTYVMTEATRKAREGKKYPEDYRITCAVGARHWGFKTNPFGKLKPTSLRQGWLKLW